MNRDRRVNPKPREFALRVPKGCVTQVVREPDDVAPWLVAQIGEWPASVEDRLVAVRIGVGLAQVQRTRSARP